MAGGGDSSQTNGARDQRAMEEGRKDEFAGDRGCGAAISIPFVQKVRRRFLGFRPPPPPPVSSK